MKLSIVILATLALSILAAPARDTQESRLTASPHLHDPTVHSASRCSVPRYQPTDSVKPGSLVARLDGPSLQLESLIEDLRSILTSVVSILVPPGTSGVMDPQQQITQLVQLIIQQLSSASSAPKAIPKPPIVQAEVNFSASSTGAARTLSTSTTPTPSAAVNNYAVSSSSSSSSSSSPTSASASPSSPRLPQL